MQKHLLSAGAILLSSAATGALPNDQCGQKAENLQRTIERYAAEHEMCLQHAGHGGSNQDKGHMCSVSACETLHHKAFVSLPREAEISTQMCYAAAQKTGPGIGPASGITYEVRSSKVVHESTPACGFQSRISWPKSGQFRLETRTYTQNVGGRPVRTWDETHTVFEKCGQQ